MKRLQFCSVLLALSAVLQGGCEQVSVPDSDKGGAARASSTAPPSAAPKSSVELKAVNCANWDKDLAAQRGKIVVVDTWATWCAPCVEEFPQLVALHGKHAKDGVTCMSVSVDELEQKGEALAFLQKHDAAFANYIIDDKGEAWWDKWEIKAIPIVLVFGRDGKLVKKFDKDDPDNQFTYADVEKLVGELVAQHAAKPGS